MASAKEMIADGRCNVNMKGNYSDLHLRVEWEESKTEGIPRIGIGKSR